MNLEDKKSYHHDYYLNHPEKWVKKSIKNLTDPNEIEQLRKKRREYRNRPEIKERDRLYKRNKYRTMTDEEKEKTKISQHNKYIKRIEYYKEKSRKNYYKDVEKSRLRSTIWRNENSDKKRESDKKWSKKNPHIKLKINVRVLLRSVKSLDDPNIRNAGVSLGFSILV